MSLTMSLFALFLLASPPARPASPAASPLPSAKPAAQASASGPVILFLIDNSASLPPLDPEEKRVEALENLRPALERARAAGVVSVVDVRTDPDRPNEVLRSMGALALQ